MKRYISIKAIPVFLAVIMMGMIIYFNVEDGSEKFRKMKIKQILNDSIEARVIKKYRDDRNHNSTNIIISNGDNRGLQQFVYFLIEERDSISKKRGSMIYMLYKGDRSDTIVYDAMKYVNKSFPR